MKQNSQSVCECGGMLWAEPDRSTSEIALSEMIPIGLLVSLHFLWDEPDRSVSEYFGTKINPEDS